MSLLPSHRYRYYTTYEPPACRTFLKSALKRSRSDGYPVGLAGRLRLGGRLFLRGRAQLAGWQPFFGSADERGFSIRPGDEVPAVIEARGRFVRDEQGTRVDIVIGTDVAVRLRTWFMLAMWPAVALGIPIASLLQGTFRASSFAANLWAFAIAFLFFLIFPGVFFAAGLVLDMVYSRRALSRVGPRLVAFLEQVLDLQPWLGPP